MAALGLTRLLVYGWAALCSLCWVLPGCSEALVADGFERVKINGEAFDLEIAADDASRLQGLSGRTVVPEDGGMIFVFPRSARRSFVMRDCLVPIDIIFLDPIGRVVATHAMTIEEPKREDESAMMYELRLKKYSSRYGAQYAIELAGGKVAQLGIKEGDLIELNHEKLKGLAR
ncbi:MAG: DUF192 domain-containing protein [Planctomycetota bacterium]